MNEKLLSADEVAAILRVSRRTVVRHRIMEQIGVVRLGRRVRCAESAVSAWIKAQTSSPRKAA